MRAKSPNPSGVTKPLWYTARRDIAGAKQRRLPRQTHYDISIVGAGITGLTCAYLLAKAGKRIIVIDEKPVAGGETGRTSAHLASALDDRFFWLENVHGKLATRRMHESHVAAIDLIERIDREENLGSGFTRVSGYLFAGENEGDGILEKELAAARRANAQGVALLKRPRLPGLATTNRPCLRFPHQARFDPLIYSRGLAAAVERLGGRIHCGTRVMDMSGDGPVTTKLRGGVTITSAAGIAATNIPTPINNWMGIYLKTTPYRSYVIGLAVKPNEMSDALYWDCEEPYHYVRLAGTPARPVLLVGGEDHKTGQPPADNPFAKLEQWARRWFPNADKVVARWSGQVSEPDDGCAFIGRVPSKGNAACYTITGDSGMGLTHGTLGAMLIRDLILGRRNPWESIYDPARKPLQSPRSAVRAIKQNINAITEQTKDFLTPGEVKTARDIPRGSGALIRKGAIKLAVYKDDSGKVSKRSAICPHLYCTVRWNSVEKSWDCPCHGSRFDCQGKLLMGPSIADLSSSPGGKS